jgi:hypothetical protein
MMDSAPLTYEYVDFEIANEGWNLYEIEDGTRLRARVVLKTVIKFGDGRYLFGVEQITGIAFLPEKLRGPPSTQKYSPEELSKNIEIEDLEFKTLKENWNVYRLSDGLTVSIKCEVTQINRTRLFNELGEPIYTVNMTSLFKVKTKTK